VLSVVPLSKSRVLRRGVEDRALIPPGRALTLRLMTFGALFAFLFHPKRKAVPTYVAARFCG